MYFFLSCFSNGRNVRLVLIGIRLVLIEIQLVLIEIQFFDRNLVPFLSWFVVLRELEQVLFFKNCSKVLDDVLVMKIF